MRADMIEALAAALAAINKCNELARPTGPHQKPDYALQSSIISATTATVEVITREIRRDDAN